MDHGSAHKRPNGEVAKKMNEYKDNQTAWRWAAFVRQQQCRHAMLPWCVGYVVWQASYSLPWWGA